MINTDTPRSLAKVKSFIRSQKYSFNIGMDPNKVIAKINALNPNPGTWFYLKGSRIKVIKAIEVTQQGKPGEILSDNWIIGCQKKAIQRLE